MEIIYFFMILIVTRPLSRTACLSVVSEREFQSLPSYLKQMTLHSLNQAVHSINKFTEEHQGQCYSTMMIKVIYKMFDQLPDLIIY